MQQLIIVILLGVLSYISEAQIYFSGEIENLQRQVNVQARYVESQISLNFKNTGNQAVYNFYYAVPNALNSTIVYALFENEDGTDTQPLIVNDPIYQAAHPDHSLYSYDLPNRVLPGKTVQIRIREMYLKRFECLPKQIDLQESQYVLFNDNKFFYSPYKVLSQKTVYITGHIRAYTDDEDDSVVKRKNQVKYGDYQNTEPYSVSDIQLHVENNTPLAYFKKATKTIEVSHWGNIAISSSFQVENYGAKLKGEFDRVNRQFQGIANSALKGLHAELPYHAWGISYGDEIGNISTSNAWRSKSDKVVNVDIKHRFPILGGWKSNFNMGYNLNTSRYIYEQHDQEQFVLKQLFSYPFLELAAQDYEVQVVLPQGAYDVDVILPFVVDSQNLGITYSYLDTEGRPTVMMTKQMVSAFNNQFFYITYKLNEYQMYKKPFILFVVYFIFFMLLIFINRFQLDANQGKKVQANNQNSQQVTAQAN